MESIQKMTSVLLKEIHDLVMELHTGRFHRQSVELDSSLDRDVGLDSLSRMELLSRIEKRFGVVLPDKVYFNALTPRDLLRAVMEADIAMEPESRPEITTLAPGVDAAEEEGGLKAPHHAQTLAEVLDWHVKKNPDRIHLRLYSDRDDGEIITFRKLKEGAEAVAAGLQSKGLAVREPVVLILPTGLDYFVSFFGILLAGGVPVPLYPPVRIAQIGDYLLRQRSILENCAASFMITMPEAKRFASLLQAHLENLKNLFSVEEIQNTPGEFIRPVIASADTTLIQYTSGSTGNPKGVALTHANLLASIRTMGQALEITSGDVIVSWLPLYHDMGLIGAWFGSLYHGTSLVIMSPVDFLRTPLRWLKAIHRYHGTLSVAPNFAYELCLKRIDDPELEGLDLSSLRACLNGAEPVSPESIRNFSNRFAKYGFQKEAMMPVYGLAECSLGLTFPPLGRKPLVDGIERKAFMDEGRAVKAAPEDTNQLRFVSCGQPLPGHEVRIVDTAGRELPDRQEGRLQFRGPSATSGYYRNPEQTRLLFQGDWLNSGDMAYIADGEIYITGRDKDIVIKAGRNIYPHELEEAVSNIEGVRKGNTAVFGSMDETSGTERLVILAETRQKGPGGSSEKLKKLRSEINTVVTDIIGSPPDDVILAPPGTLLKTSSGKIRRAAVRKLYEENKLLSRKSSVWMQIVRFALSGMISRTRRIPRIMSEGLYAGYVWAVFGLLAPFVWVSVVLLPGYPLRWGFAHRTAHLLRRLFRIPVLVKGLENLPQKRAFILVSNHASYIDGFVLTGILPAGARFVAKSELSGQFISRTFLERLQTVFVERFDKQKGIEDARRLGSLVREAPPLLILPEGTISRMPGLLPFHIGAFLAAAEAGAPVVPIAIRGTRSILRDGSWFPRRGTITVTIGPPIEPDEITDRSQAALWAAAVKSLTASRDFILKNCAEPDLSHEKAPIFTASE